MRLVPFQASIVDGQSDGSGEASFSRSSPDPRFGWRAIDSATTSPASGWTPMTPA